MKKITSNIFFPFWLKHFLHNWWVTNKIQFLFKRKRIFVWQKNNIALFIIMKSQMQVSYNNTWNYHPSLFKFNKVVLYIKAYNKITLYNKIFIHMIAYAVRQSQLHIHISTVTYQTLRKSACFWENLIVDKIRNME